MAKILLLIWIWLWLFTSYIPEPNKYEATAYKLASSENKQGIEQCKIELGMSIDECKASCPDYQFVKINDLPNGNYELWEAKSGEEKDLFLYVLDGKVEMISEHIGTELGK